MVLALEESGKSRELAAREAAHAIVAGTSRGTSGASQTLPSVHSVNVSAMDGCLAEGAQIGGKMSPVRRFFCLFVTFDLLFTFLLWLICLVISGDYKEAIKSQLHCDIKTSLFDIVLCSLCRVVVLLLMYALMRINHWWAVAITTATSSAFLLIKVFFYDWDSARDINNYEVFSVILILCSFVIAWGETWFLDFRVIPQEYRAREILEHIDNDRNPLLPSIISSTKYGVDSCADTLPFYSPLQSPPDSDEEEGGADGFDSSGPIQNGTQYDEYKQKGKETVETALRLALSDGWNLEKSSEEGDEVYSKRLPKKGKVFKLSCVVPVKPKLLLDELFYKVENITTWNPTVTCSKTLQTIDHRTDISYQVTAEAANGAVSQRDFVLLRHWELRGDVYIVGAVTVTYAKMPPQKKYVRGENGPGGCILRPADDDPHKCSFQWVLNTDLKGWLPQYLVDQAIATAMLDYVFHLRKHLVNLPRHEPV